MANMWTVIQLVTSLDPKVNFSSAITLKFKDRHTTLEAILDIITDFIYRIPHCDMYTAILLCNASAA